MKRGFRLGVQRVLMEVKSGRITPEAGAREIEKLYNDSVNISIGISDHGKIKTEPNPYDFNFHQHWKEEDDRTGYDSSPMGGFKD